MHRNQNKISVSGGSVLPLIVLNAIAVEQGFVSNPKWYCVLCITIPLLLILILMSRGKVL